MVLKFINKEGDRVDTTNDKTLNEQLNELVTKPHENEHVHLTGSTEMTIDGHPYVLVDNYHEGFDLQKLDERYADILAKYDYIVGDWGFDQLRLRGFYNNDNRHAERDQTIATLEDYLYEYCNFGCAYFVLEKVQLHTKRSNNHRHRNHHNQSTLTNKSNKHSRAKNKKNSNAFRERKIKPVQIKHNGKEKAVKVKKHGQRQFAIRSLHDKQS